MRKKREDSIILCIVCNTFFVVDEVMSEGGSICFKCQEACLARLKKSIADCRITREVWEKSQPQRRSRLPENIIPLPAGYPKNDKK